MKLSEDVLSKKRVGLWVLFIAYCGFIVWMTLLNREPIEREFGTELFWAFKRLVTNDKSGNQVFTQYIGNILFFIPFGILLTGLTNK